MERLTDQNRPENAENLQELKESILGRMKEFMDEYRSYSESSLDHFGGKADAMEMAMRLVRAAFTDAMEKGTSSIQGGAKMDVENNSSENRQGLTMWECRRLRAAMETITCTPLLTREEYLQMMEIVDRVLSRIGERKRREDK